jgi:hypothetical protein
MRTEARITIEVAEREQKFVLGVSEAKPGVLVIGVGGPGAEYEERELPESLLPGVKESLERFLDTLDETIASLPDD